MSARLAVNFCLWWRMTSMSAYLSVTCLSSVLVFFCFATSYLRWPWDNYETYSNLPPPPPHLLAKFTGGGGGRESKVDGGGSRYPVSKVNIVVRNALSPF